MTNNLAIELADLEWKYNALVAAGAGRNPEVERLLAHAKWTLARRDEALAQTKLLQTRIDYFEALLAALDRPSLH
jgi:hypothetical protein